MFLMILAIFRVTMYNVILLMNVSNYEFLSVWKIKDSVKEEMQYEGIHSAHGGLKSLKSYQKSNKGEKCHHIS